ncbi:TetR/AcrR family transcriptional regulator [Nocardioides korecus]
MTGRKQAERLLPSLPKVPKVPGSGRRARFSAATKGTLLEVATQLFTEHGFRATSLDQITAGADVTKGALYHHFSGKQAVFDAVFTAVQDDAAARIAAVARTHDDPWLKAQAALRAFLAVVQEPAYQQVVMHDGPAVLGHERFREQEERSAYGIVQEVVGSVLEASTSTLDEPMRATFSRIFFGAMSAAGQSVSAAEDPALAVARIEAAIGFILLGLRTLAEQGVGLTDPDLPTAP